jgi:hypothetical protein
VSTRYRRAEKVDWVRAGDEAVLFDSSSGDLFELDRWAASIWTALDGVESVDEISESIALSVDAPKDIVHEDVVAFCADLCARELLVPIESELPPDEVATNDRD